MKLPIPAFIRRHPWRYGIALLLLVPIAGIAFAASRPKQPEYLTSITKRGDLTQTVEAVGTVISEHNLQLQFPMAGIVSAINVREGAKVQAGQVLASIRGGNYAADIAAASAQVRSAEAQLQALLEGARPEDIAITEADVANKQSSLDAAKQALKTAETNLATSQSQLDVLRQEADVSLAGFVSTAKTTVSQELVDSENALSAIGDVFSNNDVQDAIIKSNPANYSDITVTQQRAVADIRALNARVNLVTDFSSALTLMEEARVVLQNASRTLDQAYLAIAALPTTGTFTTAEQETHKSTIATQRSVVQSSSAAVETAGKSLRDAAATYSTRLNAQEASIASYKGARDKATADIITFETSLRIAQAQLQLKKAPARQTDIAAQQAMVRQMRAALARASSNYGNTLLTAPIAGTITKVNMKLGEATPVGTAVEMLGDSPFRIEMFVSEIDVPKVQVTQSGSIELDAYRGTHMKLHVSEVDKSATDRDGVSKYRIKLDFDHPHPELKIGMTGDAEIVTGQRKDVVFIPRRAVIENDDGQPIVRVLNADATVDERPVVIGMEGATGDVEVVSGVNAGETIIVLTKK